VGVPGRRQHVLEFNDLKRDMRDRLDRIERLLGVSAIEEQLCEAERKVGFTAIQHIEFSTLNGVRRVQQRLEQSGALDQIARRAGRGARVALSV